MGCHTAAERATARRRAQRRLRRLILCGLARPLLPIGPAGLASPATGSAPGTVRGLRGAAAAGRSDRQCLALRTLSQALCHEAVAALVRRQVRGMFHYVQYYY